MPFSFVQETCFRPSKSTDKHAGGMFFKFVHKGHIILPIAVAHSTQGISTLEYPTGDDRAILFVFGPVWNRTYNYDAWYMSRYQTSKYPVEISCIILAYSIDWWCASRCTIYPRKFNYWRSTIHCVWSIRMHHSQIFFSTGQNLKTIILTPRWCMQRLPSFASRTSE